MEKKKIFISSVQSEFASERLALHEYIISDPLLGKFFDVFLFELLPAIDQKANEVYLKEVERCNIYLGLLGKQYGFENSDGISPTKLEFDHAVKNHKTKFLFLTSHPAAERHPKEKKFITKVERELIRKQFSTIDELKSAVYATLVRYLEEKEIIRTAPFDATLIQNAGIKDLDPGKIKQFVRTARSKRGFPLREESKIENILVHLNLMMRKRITNAAILLFGKQPQRFFINSEIRCAYFRGTIVSKPIPSYKVFKGSVFELTDQALDFVLSKLNYSVGTREKEVQIPGSYEIPKEIIAEAIVNAIAHRDYTSNGSVQVMLFSDRLEIWNPGSLPLGWTTEKLKHLHTSIPANPLLAEPMYLAGYIERLGTGTTDIIRLANEADLKEPEFVQEEIFKAIIYRPVTPHDTPDDTPYDAPYDNELVNRLILALNGEMSRPELQKLVGVKDIGHFREGYLVPALELNIIEMTLPDRPKSKNQRYRLTKKGISLQKQLKR
jgi:ATP-dependent DNA helicase RecG